MARVSISEAARLVSVSRPTIYKLLKSGELSYTSVVKHGKPVKTIDTAELIRLFGALDVVSGDKSDTVKFDGVTTSVN
ncbi:helix-turn-helix domain-containing protein, partial [Citrobacter freundii]|nr:helix-turn-helix domain-containing protein [Citrobacter freundii]